MRVPTTPRPTIESVWVVIPVHDEEERIEAALTAVASAARATAVNVGAVIVLDACTDGTEAIVRGRMHHDRSLEWQCTTSPFRRASSSRGVGLDLVVAATAHRSPTSVAVLSTDADSEVPVDWITHHVELLDAGSDAVAGIVDLPLSPDDGLCHDSWRAEYTSGFRSDGTHPHVHCANLSVRLDLLLRAGGFGDLARAEDIDLWRRLDLVGARRASDQSSVVSTSSRPDGRVSGGFATALGRFRVLSAHVVDGPPAEETSPTCTTIG